MITLSFDSNLKQVQSQLDQFTRALQTKAIVRAVNNTTAFAKVSASRDIREAGYNITAKAVKASIEVVRATPGNLEAVMNASGKGIPRIAFGARQTAKGVSYAIKGGRKVVPSAFIATMKSGHRGAFVRLAGMQLGKRGQPILNRKIAELWGPSVPTMLMNTVVRKRLEDAIREKFPVELQRQIRFIGLKVR